MERPGPNRPVDDYEYTPHHLRSPAKEFVFEKGVPIRKLHRDI